MEGSHLRNAYRAAESMEEYHCSFGLNGRYRRLIESGPLCVSAVDDQQEIRAVEMDGHPFFVATLFQPEMSAAAESAGSGIRGCVPPSPADFDTGGELEVWQLFYMAG